MKRGIYVVVGIVIGLLLALPISAMSDSLLGKQVDMTAPVKLDGQYLEVDAIGIKGTTYAPVRVFAEALGKDVDWVDGEVIIETPDSPETVEGDGMVNQQPINDNTPSDLTEEGIDHIAVLRDAIRSNNENINKYRDLIEFNIENGSEESNSQLEEAISKLEQENAAYEQKIRELGEQGSPDYIAKINEINNEIRSVERANELTQQSIELNEDLLKNDDLSDTDRDNYLLSIEKAREIIELNNQKLEELRTEKEKLEAEIQE